MKKLLFILSIFFIGQINAQNWAWAKDAGGSSGEGWSVATDNFGNVYVTGMYNSLITFGTYTLTDTHNPTFNVFFAKYDVAGNLLWAKSSDGIGNAWCNSISTDKSGNFYLTGYYSHFITYGNDTLTNITNGSAIFLVKFNSSGNVIWKRSIGGTNTDEGFSVTTDASNNVYVTGKFTSPSITFGTYTLNAVGTQDIFLAKYDSTGTVLWAKGICASGTNTNQGNCVTTDAFKNLYITGQFSSNNLNLGAYTVTNTSIGVTDVFVAKYDSLGNNLWAKSFGGGKNDKGLSLVTDISNNLYVTGGFASASCTIGTYTISNPNSGFYNDIFLVKYNTTNGNVFWAQRAGGPLEDIGYSLARDPYNNLYLSGGFASTYCAFGSDTLFHPSTGSDPMFIAKYNSSGIIQCLSALSSGGDDNNAVATDSLGNAYIVGDYANSKFVVGSDTLIESAPGDEDFFIAKYFCSMGDGISEYTSKLKINVFPNPTNDQFVIETNATEKLKVDLYDVNGRHVFSASINDKSNINVATLDNGIYTLTIKSVDGVTNKKLVIAR